MRSTCTAFVGAVGTARRLSQRSGVTCTRAGSWTLRAPLRRHQSAVCVTLQQFGRVVANAAQTQQQTEWNVVSVLENRVVCEGHRLLVLDVGTTGQTGSLCDSYRVPGMFVKLRVGEGMKPGFFAISCAPNLQGVFEFLIKDAEGTAWVEELVKGGNVEISPVMGKGFPMGKLDLLTYPETRDEEKVYDVLLFATGSGIAPIRAVIESRLNGINARVRRRVRLFYGCRNEERMAYKERFVLWKQDGVEVIPVMSREGEEWKGNRGYVQTVLGEMGVESPKQTAAVLCGVKGMTEDVKKYLMDAGVREDRILFNF